ncbi:ABC-2 transporter permease protein [Alteracholeplasma palmae J233]|uniref:Transport permease protein n=1 Tax=Alteracholeplasma palmae (strain ATCC 49389 / J233) TaxID=1318466 RepID=U4KJW0_ALTPJ|nr:ABC transporter permease [Alteracholeplasma palmae]CCV63743.1 ABC-2 transporter permease protein [Alteracholeplasma palmae J233]
MYNIFELTKRNIKIYLRDKTAVFFSFLSVIIMLLLYFLFLNNMYTQGFDAFDITDKQKTFLATSQMMAGILVINTLTLSLGIMGNMVSDLEHHKIDSFLVTPVKRYKIFLSYYLSAVIVTFVLTLIMWILTILYLLVSTGYIYDFSTILEITLLLLVYTFISSSIMVLLVSFIKSANAFGAVSGVLGTFVGFVSGIYMPLAILPKAVSYISSLIPFTHMTTLLKQKMLEKPFSLIIDKMNPEAVSEMKNAYGVNDIGIFGLNISSSVLIICSIGLSVILFGLTIYRLSKKDK